MRKILLMAAAGMALTFAAPLTASATPAMHLEAVQLAAQDLGDTAAAAWHCRRWSGWCRSRVYRSYRRVWRRWR